MRYIGSKLRLLNFIENTIKQYCGKDLSGKVFCDIFSGTGVVGKTFSPMVKKVIANDFEWYAYASTYVALKGYNTLKVEERLHDLNALAGIKSGSLYEAYVEGGKSGRLYFSNYNGAKLAAARRYLDMHESEMEYNDYMAVLLSIIDGADKVANTMSTYGAYAKKLKSNSIKPIEFTMPKMADNASEENEVYMWDANLLIKEIHGDILYLDPPYNNRQYGSNYHLLNAIAKGWAPKTDSVTGVKKDDYNKSTYCREKTVGDSLEQLIKDANFEWVFLSYNNEGLLSFEEIQSIMEKYGTYFMESTDYQRYKADSNRNQAADSVIEYIHILHKGVFEERKGDKPNLLSSLIKGTPKVEANEGGDVIATAKVTDNSKEVTLQSIALQADMPDSYGIVYPAEVLKSAVEAFKSGNIDGARLGEITHSVEKKIASKKDYIVSPMNYMGGKKKLLPQLLDLFPKGITHFVDLFCGGGTVGVNSPCGSVTFNDNIAPLIEMYEYMYRHDYYDGVKYIDEQIEKWHLTQENEDAYYAFREQYNSAEAYKRHPLDLFILMAYSFNNQIRFNEKKGTFNIPFGKNRSSFNDKMRENLEGFWVGLQAKNCTFTALDFSEYYMDALPPDSFIYADPPYLISQATYNSGWSKAEEMKLYEVLLHADLLGYKFALSNVLENKGERNTMLEQWAKYHNFNVIHLEKSYANSYYHRKEKESKTDEVLITNYKTD